MALSVDAGGDRASVDGTREPTELAPPGPTLDGGGEPGDGGHHAGSGAATSHAVHRPSSAWDLGCRVQGTRFKFWDLGFGVWGLRFWILDSRTRD